MQLIINLNAKMGFWELIVNPVEFSNCLFYTTITCNGDCKDKLYVNEFNSILNNPLFNLYL